MKRLFITILFFIMVLSIAHSQNAGKFGLGLRMGVPFGLHEAQDHHKAWLKINKLEKKSMPGFLMAIHGLYGFNDYIGLQTELNFTIGLGIKGKRDEDHWADSTYSCLDIPVLLKINFINSQSTRFGILAGPYFTTALGNSDTKYHNYTNSDEEYDIKASHFGITGGLFFTKSFNILSLIVDFRYLNDFEKSTLSVLKKNDYEFMKRRALALTVGIEYTFR